MIGRRLSQSSSIESRPLRKSHGHGCRILRKHTRSYRSEWRLGIARTGPCRMSRVGHNISFSQRCRNTNQVSLSTGFMRPPGARRQQGGRKLVLFAVASARDARIEVERRQRSTDSTQGPRSSRCTTLEASAPADRQCWPQLSMSCRRFSNKSERR
jgi:hypothetical protein